MVASDFPPVPPSKDFISATYLFNYCRLFLVIMHCCNAAYSMYCLNKCWFVLLSYFTQLAPCALFKMPLAGDDFTGIILPHCFFNPLKVGTRFIRHYKYRVKFVIFITNMFRQSFVEQVEEKSYHFGVFLFDFHGR